MLRVYPIRTDPEDLIPLPKTIRLVHPPRDQKSQQADHHRERQPTFPRTMVVDEEDAAGGVAWLLFLRRNDPIQIAERIEVEEKKQFLG